MLDLACGTGDLTFAAAATAPLVVGLDLTHGMLRLARARGAGTFICGDMSMLPFPGASFTVVTTGYGLRNVPDLRAALQEIRRVLAPGGRLLSLDFNRPSNAFVRAAYLTYLNGVGSLLGLVLHRDPNTYRYIPESIRLYPGADGVAAMMRDVGFTEIRVERVLGGLMAIHAATVPATAPAR